MLNLDTLPTCLEPLNPREPIDPYNASKLAPVLMLIDYSDSVRNYVQDINNCIREFTNVLRQNAYGERFCIEFGIIAFRGEDIWLMRDIGLMKDSEPVITLKEEDCGGTTPLASALIQAYRYMERRKSQYKQEIGNNYRQPIFLVISDFLDNDNTEINETPDACLYDAYVAPAFCRLEKEKKLMLFKLPLRVKEEKKQIAKESMDCLPGTPMDGTVFAKSLMTFFSVLSASVRVERDQGGPIVRGGERRIRAQKPSGANRSLDQERMNADLLAKLNEYYNNMTSDEA
jgi:uncharacterized protein YegL